VKVQYAKLEVTQLLTVDYSAMTSIYSFPDIAATLHYRFC